MTRGMEARMPRSGTLVRIAALLLIILAFARLAWALDAKNLWWDESLSLQRAESDWWTLLRGEITIFDGVSSMPTIDQHPFGYFVILGMFVRLAGDSNEFVLRFPSLMAAVLLVPALWTLGRWCVKQGIVPDDTPFFAALFAAFSPFHLWYGQEVRMYTLVALLAVLNGYWLLRWLRAGTAGEQNRAAAAYLAVLGFFLVTHYFAILQLPVHAVAAYLYLVRQSRRRALLVVGGLTGGVAAVVGLAAWLILRQGYSGTNFAPITLAILLPDLINAYSLGLSVDIVQVWGLDLLFGACTLLGGGWVLWRGLSKAQINPVGSHEKGASGPMMPGTIHKVTATTPEWFLPALLLFPIAALLVMNQIQPAYMNARHMALISGLYILFLATGVATIGRWSRQLSAVLALILVVGMLYSTWNYFTRPEYDKDHFAEAGAVLRQNLAPGDALVLDPPHLERLYRYYLPVDLIEQARSTGTQITWRGVPALQATWEENEALLAQLVQGYRRVWLVESGMFPFVDPDMQVEALLAAHALPVRQFDFHSQNTYLRLLLFVPTPPVTDTLPADVQPVHAQFGDAVRLEGYSVRAPLTGESGIPVTFYWRAVRQLETRHKYIIRLEGTSTESSPPASSVAEREPYDGAVPTIWWTPDVIVVEQMTLERPAPETDRSQTLNMLLQVYDSETLAKLPVTAQGAGALQDAVTLRLAFPAPPPEFVAPSQN